jgi:hypothetical protein
MRNIDPQQEPWSALIEHIRRNGGLALSAFQPMIDRRGPVHRHHDGGRRRAADVRSIIQGSHPNGWRQPGFVTTATCTPTQCVAPQEIS